jgi:SAM-dependent methyltransferase
MKYVLEILESNSPGPARDRTPILWSEAHKERLRRIATGEIAALVPVDPALSLSLLKCADGLFAEAERDILALLRENIIPCEADNEFFTSFLNALFTVQRFDMAAAMLRDRNDYSGRVSLAVQRFGPGYLGVKWDILGLDDHRFTFDAVAYENDNTRIAILLFQWTFSLCSYYAKQRNQRSGSVIINVGDIGAVPGLAFCDSRPDRFLIPDNVFISTKGYGPAREIYRTKHVPWSERKPVAFWRGTTTGIQRVPGDWRSLERIKLCELAIRDDLAALIDAGISGVVQFDDPAIVQEIERSGLIRGFVPWQDWNQYKYHVDIDGNTNSWSAFFYRLLSGSPVLKVESAHGWLQWFYDRLVPWQNFIPVSSDMSDLVDKIRWLTHNNAVAEKIGQRGWQLADEMTYEREIARAVPVISAAFRHFAGQEREIGPHGRPDVKPRRTDPEQRTEQPMISSRPVEATFHNGNDDQMLRRILGWDETWYRQRYPDVNAACERSDFASAFHHYLCFGRFEERFPSAAAETEARQPGGPQPRYFNVGRFTVPLNWPVKGEPTNTFLLKLTNGFFEKFMSGAVILDIGYKGGNPAAVPILPHATGVDLDYPGYDGIHLPFADASVDTVFASHVLEHIVDYRSAVRDWFRTLRMGGFIVCVVPHQFLYEKKREPPSRWNGDHKRFYTPGSLLREFEESLPPNGYRVRHVFDNDLGYLYEIGPERHAAGSYEIELVIEKIKPPAWDLG